jgi:hypothetical protein
MHDRSHSPRPCGLRRESIPGSRARYPLARARKRSLSPGFHFFRMTRWICFVTPSHMWLGRTIAKSPLVAVGMQIAKWSNKWTSRVYSACQVSYNAPQNYFADLFPRAGSTSYSDCTGLTCGFSSATDIARMRILSFCGNAIVFAPAGTSIA